MENRLTAYETFQRTNQGEGRADAGTERTFPGGICTGEDSGQCGTGFPWCCGTGQKPEWESCKACKGKTAAKKRGKTDTERIKRGTHSGTGRASFFCIGNKNKPPAMQVCSQTALASSKKPPCYNEYKVRQPNHYNKEESKWTIIVYHTQNGHANII